MGYFFISRQTHIQSDSCPTYFVIVKELQMVYVGSEHAMWGYGYPSYDCGYEGYGGGCGFGHGFALLVVLFILLIIIGATWVRC